MVDIKQGIVRRRGILAGVATVVAGALARLTAQPVHAGIDGDLVLNASNTGTAITTLQSLPAGGSGYTVLRVTNLRIADAILADGGPGSLGNAGGRGINATGGNNDDGSFALPSAGGDAILGTGGNTISAVGSGGRGVRGVGGAAGTGTGGTGVEGTGGAPNGAGVRGAGGGSAGSQGSGVVAVTNSTSNAALQANNNGAGPGARGEATSGPGVLGEATSGPGVRGEATSGFGVFGESTSGVGVFGQSANSFGIFGTSGSSFGCGGASTAPGTAGLFGFSSTPGVIGLQGIHTVAGGFAGFFSGDVFITGSLTVASGAKSAAVKKKDGSMARVYCQESPEPWFEDFGTAELKGGQASVALDPEFDEVVKGDDYRVFLTPIEVECSLYVSRKGPHQFVVRTVGGAAVNGSFDYRVVARRAEAVGARLEKVQVPSVDVEKLKRDISASTAAKPTPGARR